MNSDRYYRVTMRVRISHRLHDVTMAVSVWAKSAGGAIAFAAREIPDSFTVMDASAEEVQ